MSDGKLWLSSKILSFRPSRAILLTGCDFRAGVKLIGCDEKAKRKESDEKVKRKEFCYSAGWWRYGTEGDCKLIGT